MFGFFGIGHVGRTPQQVADSRKIRLLKAQLEEAREILEEIVSIDEPDKGIVLIDPDSPTYWCHEKKAWVYRYVYFSRLGGALIELHDKLKEQR